MQEETNKILEKTNRSQRYNSDEIPQDEINKTPQEISGIQRKEDETKSTPQEDHIEVEDIMIMCDADDLAKLFFTQDSIIWYNPDTESTPKFSWLDRIKQFSDVVCFTKLQKTVDYIRKSPIQCHIITSGRVGESSIIKISKEPTVKSIYILCNDTNLFEGWIGQHPKVISVENKFNSLLYNLRRNLLKLDLPAFGPVFDDMDISRMAKMHYYLKGFVKFKNRTQAKKDFLRIAGKVYQDNSNMLKFTRDYDQYHMNTIFNWYTRQSFFFKTINNCLRIATADSILYSRLIIKDLETAIMEQFQTKSRRFSGILYRVCSLLDPEWDLLKANISKEIEMYGFLSTTKNKDSKFIKRNLRKGALITIIVPDFPNLKDRGFAEISEFSQFVQEQEVLFNVRSKFTVLEAKDEVFEDFKQRHLILLYGAQAMRRFLYENKPQIEIHLSGKDQIRCKECSYELNAFKERANIMFVSLSDTNEYICQNCMNKSLTRKSSPYVVIPLHVCEGEEAIDNIIKVQGMILKYQEDLNLPFYGSKCTICQKSVTYKNTCIDCAREAKVWCHECFNEK